MLQNYNSGPKESEFLTGSQPLLLSVVKLNFENRRFKFNGKDKSFEEGRLELGS